MIIITIIIVIIITIKIKKLWETAFKEGRKRRNPRIGTRKWNDKEPNQQGCFVWLKGWKDAPTHTIAAVMELYEH